jgi:type I restriction enzyme, S subunit
MNSRSVALGSIARITSGGTPDRANPAYWDGPIPWVKTTLVQNREIALSDIDETITEAGLQESSAKMIPAGSILMAMIGQGKTRGQVAMLTTTAAINQNCAAITLNADAHAGYVYQQLLFRYREIRNASNSSGQQNLNAELIRQLRMPLPEHSEQIKIADILNAWDIAIQKAENLIVAKKRRLDHFRNLLLHRSVRGALTRLHAVTNELTRRNGTTLGREAIMAVTKQVGMRPMRDETIAANIERYKMVPPRAFAYNPMRLNIGSIAMSSFDTDVLVSPDYVVFACEESQLLPGYLNHIRHSDAWKSHFELAGNGSVRVRIYYDDLGTFSFCLPTIEEQTMVVKSLDSAAQEIALRDQQIDALRIQKRGLMQKLLTGQRPEQEAG